MGIIREHTVSLFTAAIFSADDAAIQWGIDQLVTLLGTVLLTSEIFLFDETKYYVKHMGEPIKKQLVLFGGTLDPSELYRVKVQTNDLEVRFKDTHKTAVERPLNIDPGYITPSKFILATTKDGSHRIYIKDGIYGEVTLHYRDESWNPYPWTYPDYRHGKYFDFLNRARELLLEARSQHLSL